MKKILFLILLILNIGIVTGTDYSKIDKHSETVPQNLRTAGDITRYLTKNLTSPTEKVRAIYYWIAHNIRYDLVKMNSNATYTNPQELVDEVLKSRKGVCANYSALFTACCQSVNIQSFIIEGYTSQYGKVINIAHAWNAVKIDGRFYEIDATWAAGYLKGNSYTHLFRDDYFMIQPEVFIKTHMPFDPIWQFSNYPISHKEFESGNFSLLKKGSYFNYSDSIKVYSGLRTLEKLVGEDQRIEKSGITNRMIQNKIDQNQQGIASEKYNIAAQKFNKGVEKFNYYIQIKNKQFENLSMKEDKILELLSSSRQLFESADQTLTEMNSGHTDLDQMIKSMKKSIRVMMKDLEVEDSFVMNYISTAKSKRLFLFYRKNE